MSAPARCIRCGGKWHLDSPDYGGGATYAHWCHGSRVQRREEGGGRYIGGGRYSLGPPEGYYARRRKQLITEALGTHAADCTCMACAVGRKEAP